MPHHLIAAAAAHTWSKEWTGGVTGLTSIAFFWLGMLNITLLTVFLSLASKRFDLRAQARRRDTVTTHPMRCATDRPSRRATDEQPAPAVELEPAAARMLVSDAERDEAADVVCRAIADGRLSIAEGTARIDKVLTARRRATLLSLLDDLPLESPPTRGLGPTAGILALRVAAAALIAGAAVLQGLAGIWALWPVAIAALAPLAFSPRHLHGPARQRTARPAGH